MSKPSVFMFFEEALLIALMMSMVLLTFFNVVLRYVFNTALVWSLELTLILFAWMVLLGVSYGFKKTLHLGVDACVEKAPARLKRVAGVISALACLVYASLLLKGAWDYWAPFADLPPTTGRFFPTGFDQTARGISYFETDQLPMIESFRFLEPLINYDEPYEKLPRVVPYAILPLAAVLMCMRTIEVVYKVVTRQRDYVIIRHDT